MLFGEENPSTSNSSCQPRPISTASSRPTSRPSLPQQTNISNYVSKKVTVSDKKIFDKLLLGMITREYQPFSIVEDKGFIAFVKAINPSYTLPSRKVLTQSILSSCYESCLNEVKGVMELVLSVCLTPDCWTSVNNEGYMAITAHYLDNDFKLKSVLLECSVVTGHTSENLAAQIKLVTEKFNVSSKVISVVSDNASNVKKAIKEELK